MLGRSVSDPRGVEVGGEQEGLGLLPVDTVLEDEKVRTNYTGRIVGATGMLSDLAGADVSGYEIHMGRTEPLEKLHEFTSGETGYCKGNVYGTYVHGFFDKKEVAGAVIRSIAKARGKTVSTDGLLDYDDFKDSQYDLLAAGLKESMDMDYIYKVMGV